jgi:DNA-binding response OmpR family regulator
MESSPHILIVDDDREIRDLLSRILVKNGYRSATAWFRNATTPPSPGKRSVNF